MKKSLFWIIGFIFIMVSCKNETETYNASVDNNYFPSDSGSWVEYRVDSVLYSDFYYVTPPGVSPPQYLRTSTHYVKEIITERFIDNLGREARKIERYSKDSLQHEYTDAPRIWYMVKNSGNIEKVEENLRYIKLIFPSTVDASWKGNKYIRDSLPFTPLRFTSQIDYNWEYVITERDKVYNNGFKTFDSTLSVTQFSDSSLVYRLESYEKYARNVGLVYKEMWRLDAQQPIRNQVIPFMVSKLDGFIVKQYAIANGHL